MALTRPDLKRSSPVPLKRQIVQHITAAIESGELQPGEKLPAGRDLAEEWEVGYSTITDAMRELVASGTLVAAMGKGTFVAELQQPRPRATRPRPSRDDSGCILNGPDWARCSRIASRGMTEEDDEGARIPFRNAEYRYVQVADDLEQRIRSGEFPHDSRLPRRGDLAAEYNVGEMTIRRALRVLAGERGLVRLMPSVGTVVTWRPGHETGTP